MTDGPDALVPFARRHLVAAIESATSSVWLASPFLSRTAARDVAPAARLCAAHDLHLLTALDARSVQAGVLDPKALRDLALAGFAIRTIRNLHAKVALTDATWGLVGSGNLTGAGLGGDDGAPSAQNANIELGVILSTPQVTHAMTLYEDWWERAEPVSLGMIARYDALPRFPRRAGAKLPRGPHLLPSADAVIADLMAGASNRTHWMKAAYHRPGQDTDGWWSRGWISDRRAAPYAIGDHIVLYVGGRHGAHCCPAVLEVRDTATEDGDFVAAQGRGDADRQWPYVTRTRCVLDVPLALAPHPRDFSIDPRSTQPGYRRLSAAQFEDALRAMVAGAQGDLMERSAGH